MCDLETSKTRSPWAATGGKKQRNILNVVLRGFVRPLAVSAGIVHERDYEGFVAYYSNIQSHVLQL